MVSSESHWMGRLCQLWPDVRKMLQKEKKKIKVHRQSERAFAVLHEKVEVKEEANLLHFNLDHKQYQEESAKYSHAQSESERARDI